jgi:hypothetical protein
MRATTRTTRCSASTLLALAALVLSAGTAGAWSDGHCGSSSECNDRNACTTDVCTASHDCKHTAIAGCRPCDDVSDCTEGDKCTIDTCEAGVCKRESVVCTASDQCHVAGTCNPATGSCNNPKKTNGSTCNDGNGCTQTDTCQNGTCTGGNPVVCTALDQCHDCGSCNPQTGVCSTPAKPNGTPCNDGNACTPTDTCQAGTCSGMSIPGCEVCSTPADCNDQNACTVDVCASGVCGHATIADCEPCGGDGDCSDGNGCTTDTCAVGVFMKWSMV